MIIYKYFEPLMTFCWPLFSYDMEPGLWPHRLSHQLKTITDNGNTNQFDYALALCGEGR